MEHDSELAGGGVPLAPQDREAQPWANDAPQRTSAGAFWLLSTLRNGASKAGRPTGQTVTSRERRYHFTCEPLELSRIVRERVEENELGAGVCHRADPRYALLRGTRDHVL